MIDFQLVEKGFFGPFRCPCGESRGPLVDTRFDIEGYGRVYLCELHVKTAARVLGIGEGAKMDELLNAAALLRSAERDLITANDRAGSLQAQLHDAEQKNEALAEQSELQRGRINQLEQRIASEAQAALQLVQGGVDATVQKNEA